MSTATARSSSNPWPPAAPDAPDGPSAIPSRGDLGGGVCYHKHGYGFAVHARSWHVDFDFGDAGQIDGFDAWRLASFAGGKLAKYGFASVDELRCAFAAAVDACELRYSGYILYYLADPATGAPSPPAHEEQVPSDAVKPRTRSGDRR